MMKLLAMMISVCLLPMRMQAAEVDFSHDIVPLLKEHCGKCHTGDAKKGGLSFNTRTQLMTGGESGKIVVAGKSSESELLKRLTTSDMDERMPPKGPALSAEKIALVKKWIDAGLPWEEGFTFGSRAYEPPLKPRRPELPAAVKDRTNPVDRILDAQLAARKAPVPANVDDATFARRVYLDLIGLLPTPEELTAFLTDNSPDKRTTLVQQLLARDVDYAEHWLTFWNDLLRNDYSGTGFITGGRKQISKWLYDALLTNKPYDEFARELIAPPSQESAGFIQGIRWRGEVSAGQTVEIQFAQNVAQAFLGINLKCASCHDSFIDRWTLDEAYGIAAIFATAPMEIHRCDIPTGKTAKAGWLFPELGTIDVKAPQPERLKQLAALMTHEDNGRFTRTIVNRLWHRLMGRGIVHPTDAMQTQPWNADLLDHLAVHLADNKYDLKKTLELIATSQAYQSRTQVVSDDTMDDRGYVYAGPRSRRMTAEQFLDAVWQITGSAPAKMDAPVTRGTRNSTESDQPALKPDLFAGKLTGQWIWSYENSAASPANETVTFARTIEFKKPPTKAVAVVTCDNGYALYINNKLVQSGDNWEEPDTIALTNHFKAGSNQILIVATNGGSAPNPAGLFFEARLTDADGNVTALASDKEWQWTSKQPQKNGKFKEQPNDWKPAEVVKQDFWSQRVSGALTTGLSRNEPASKLMVRASLLKSDFLMRSLGRPNRDQIVSVRPADLTMLVAIDLSNGQTLADALARGAKMLTAQQWESPEAFVRWLYQFALGRQPGTQELSVFRQMLGPKLTETGVEDALWSVMMLPEFQMVR